MSMNLHYEVKVRMQLDGEFIQTPTAVTYEILEKPTLKEQLDAYMAWVRKVAPIVAQEQQALCDELLHLHSRCRFTVKLYDL